MLRRLWLFFFIAGAAALMAPPDLAAQSASSFRADGYIAPHGRSAVTVALQDASRDRSKGALWGGAIGLVGGGILGGISVESESNGVADGGLVEASATGEAVILGALAGAGIGALLGATVFAPAGPRAASAFRVTPLVGLRQTGVIVRLR